VLPVADVGVGCVELLRVLCRPGDALVVNTPVYPPFFHWAAETGLELVQVPLLHDPAAAEVASVPGGSTWRALEAAFEPAPAPTAVQPAQPRRPRPLADELAAVAQLAARYGARVIADEIHAPLVLAGSSFTPFLTVPGGDEVGVSVVSASKAFNLAGLKCAQVVTASPAMAAALEGIPEDVRWRVGHFGILASLAAYRDGGGWLDALLSTLGQRHEQLQRLLTDRLPHCAASGRRRRSSPGSTAARSDLAASRRALPRTRPFGAVCRAGLR
jgi:cystathionine beta-lyase